MVADLSDFSISSLKVNYLAFRSNMLRGARMIKPKGFADL